MSENKSFRALKIILFVLLGFVAVFVVHEAAHAIASLAFGEPVEIGMKYGFLPYIVKPAVESVYDPNAGLLTDGPLYLYVSAMAAIIVPVLIGAFSWIRLKKKSAAVTHSWFWIAYSAPLVVFSILNVVMYFIEKDVIKQNECDLMLAINTAPAAIGVKNGVDLNRSIAFSVIGICAVAAYGYISAQIRRLRKIRKHNKAIAEMLSAPEPEENA